MSDTVVACPACSLTMRREGFQKKLGGDVAIDICPGCKLIWFDRFENLQLAAGGLLGLFKLIHAHHDHPAIPIPARLDCPRCGDRLALTHDLQRSTRFAYYRCGQGHGKLTAFYQFLREKNFVRSLNPTEVARLKADVKQVRCSGCGAPINLESDSACRFCKAPIDVLDGDALRVALSGLLADQQQRQNANGDPASVESLIAVLEAAASARGRNRLLEDVAKAGADGAPDLLDVGIGLVARGYAPAS